MKKWLKRISVVIVALVVAVGAYAGVLLALDREPMISEARASWIYNVYDLREVVGFADHAFVGRVVSNNGREFPIGNFHWPYTNYDIEVLEVIKGDLALGVIPVQKEGGLLRFSWLNFFFYGGRRIYRVLEGDSLPQVGNTYLFTAVTWPDGTITINGSPNANLLLQDGSAPGIARAYAEHDYIAQALEAYENQIVFDRERAETPAEFRAE